MKYRIHRQFQKDFKLLPKPIQKQVKQFISKIEISETLSGLPVRKMAGINDYYRWRTGKYRLGFSVEAGTVTFRRVLHRQQIYKRFP